MPTTFTREWDDNEPADTDSISEGAARIREFKGDIRERFDVEHHITVTTAPAYDGMHKWNTKVLVNTDSPYTVLTTDTILLIDASSGAIELRFPACDAAGVGAGKRYHLIVIDNTNSITLTPNGTNTINGAASITLKNHASITGNGGTDAAGKWKVPLIAGIDLSNTFAERQILSKDLVFDKGADLTVVAGAVTLDSSGNYHEVTTATGNLDAIVGAGQTGHVVWLRFNVGITIRHVALGSGNGIYTFNGLDITPADGAVYGFVNHAAQRWIMIGAVPPSGIIATNLATDAVETLKIKNAAVTQAKLATSTGSVSSTPASGSTVTERKTLPGGEYGFYPQCKTTPTAGANYTTEVNVFKDSSADPAAAYGTFVYITVAESAGGGETATCYVQQRYVTSSGEIYWIFIERDKVTKKIASIWEAPDHPVFGSNCSPDKIPHPHSSINTNTHEIVVVQAPQDENGKYPKWMEDIYNESIKSGRCISQVIREDYVIDEESNPEWSDKEITLGYEVDIYKNVKRKMGKIKKHDMFILKSLRKR